MKPKDPKFIVGKTNYLGEFTSSIVSENIFATQFHPEKSSAAGLQLLENFVKWDGAQLIRLVYVMLLDYSDFILAIAR